MRMGTAGLAAPERLLGDRKGPWGWGLQGCLAAPLALQHPPHQWPQVPATLPSEENSDSEPGVAAGGLTRQLLEGGEPEGQ